MNFNKGAAQNILVGNIYLPFLCIPFFSHTLSPVKTEQLLLLVQISACCLFLFGSFLPQKILFRIYINSQQKFSRNVFHLFLRSILIIHIEDWDISAKSELFY